MVGTIMEFDDGDRRCKARRHCSEILIGGLPQRCQITASGDGNSIAWLGIGDETLDLRLSTT